MWQLAELHPAFQKNIEDEFLNRLPQNQSVSLEMIFQNCIMLKNPSTLVFLPGSPAFQNYGPQITINLITDTADTEELMHNLSLEPAVHSYGTIKALLIDRKNATEEQVDQLKTEGISTNDIILQFTFSV